MKVQSKLNNYRSSARKVREVAPLLKGLDVVEAEWQLENLNKGCAQDLKKLLLSAISNAQNNNGLDKDNLIISELVAQEGRTLKRWMPRAYGRASSILKRSCHVILTLEEKEEGKGRKKVAKPVPNEEKIKQGKSDDQKDASETVEEGKKEQDKNEELLAKEDRNAPKDEKNAKSAGSRKIFRRKSF